MSIEHPELHATTSNHRELITKDKMAVCGYCTRAIDTAFIVSWIDNNQTALCPKCGVDCLIPAHKLIDYGVASISDIHSAWFGGDDTA